MIRDGDRILLGVSGGKDSLSLLAILRHLQAYAPVRFTLGIVTVDPQIPGFDPNPLRAYYDHLGVTWFYEQHPILEQAKARMSGNSFCVYCARMKRGIMYGTCRREGYAESLLLSLFHGGQLRTMRAWYLNDKEDIRVIHPLVYCRERQTADFARTAKLPVIPESCPTCFSAPTRREHMKALLAREEVDYPYLFANILHAMRPLLTEGDRDA